MRIKKQSFWELGTIQGASVGQFGFMLGGTIAHQYGNATALVSVCIGNLILWIIGLTVITASISDGSSHAVRNFRVYFGHWGGFFSAVIILLVLLGWFSVQLSASVQPIFPFLSKWVPWLSSHQLGAFFGLITALFAIKNINFIRKLALILVPFFTVVIFYFMMTSQTSEISEISPEKWTGISSGILFTIFTWLISMINLPTFFRHAKSDSDAYFGLTVMTIISTFFSCSSIWIGVDTPSQLFSLSDSPGNFSVHTIVVIIFILLSAMMANLVNIYYVSASWESFSKQKPTARLFLFTGLVGTVLYMFLKNEHNMALFVEISTNILACMGVVLVLSFMVRILVRHRPRPLDKVVSNFCWIIGALTSISYSIDHPEIYSSSPMLHGIGTSILVFILIVFGEETLWAIREVKQLG